MKSVIAMVALVAGCAGAQVGARKTAQTADSRTYNVMPLRLGGVREGELTSRETSRLDNTQTDTVVLQQRLQAAFDAELGRHVHLRGDAPLTIVPTLTLTDNAGAEGLAAETADAVLDLKLVDCNDLVVDEVTLKATADAPLSRPGSREHRLQSAVEKIADRYAARLEKR